MVREPPGQLLLLLRVVLQLGAPVALPEVDFLQDPQPGTEHVHRVRNKRHFGDPVAHQNHPHSAAFLLDHQVQLLQNAANYFPLQIRRNQLAVAHQSVRQEPPRPNHALLVLLLDFLLLGHHHWWV